MTWLLLVLCELHLRELHGISRPSKLYISRSRRKHSTKTSLYDLVEKNGLSRYSITHGCIFHYFIWIEPRFLFVYNCSMREALGTYCHDGFASCHRLAYDRLWEQEGCTLARRKITTGKEMVKKIFQLCSGICSLGFDKCINSAFEGVSKRYSSRFLSTPCFPPLPPTSYALEKINARKVGKQIR